MTELHAAFTLSNSEPHFCRKEQVQLDPLHPEAQQQIQIFVKEGQRLRVLRLGLFEVLRDVIPFLEDCYATCGTRLSRLNCIAMDESLNAGSTTHVFRRLRGGARAGGNGIGSVPWQWQCVLCGADKCCPTRPCCCRCAQPRTLSHSFTGGRPAHVLVVVPGRGASPELGGSSPAPGTLLVPGLVFGLLGKAPAPKGSKPPPTTRAAGFTSPAPGFKPPSPGAGVGFPPPGPSLPPPRGKGPVVPPPAPQPGPSLGPSQASLMNAHALLSNIPSPSEVDRLRKLVDLPHLPQPVEPPMITLPWDLLPKRSTKNC